jgi:hypothetical protein
MLVVGAALAVAISPILDVYSTAEAGSGAGSAIDRAALWMAGTSVLAGLIGAAVGGLESVVRLGPGGRRRARWAGISGIALLVAVGGVLLLTYGGRVAHFVGNELSAVTSGREAASSTSSTRFAKTTLYERPDYWRVSLEMFDQHPIAGAGAGNFEQQYTIHRDKPKYSRYAHDIWLRALGENGVVGLALLLAFVIVTFAVPLSGIRRLDGWSRGVVAGCLAVTGYFLIHASFDWLDEIPALAAPAIGLAFVAIALSRPSRPDDRQLPVQAHAQITPVPRRSRRGALGPALGGAALMAVALVALVLPYLSDRFVERALSGWRTDPAGAFRDLDRAAALNPLSSVPRMTEGTIAVSLRQPARARRAFRRALDVERTWYPYMELALLDAQEGRFRAARSEISRASRLSPRDPFIAKARRLVLARATVDPHSFNRKMEKQIRASFAPSQN